MREIDLPALVQSIEAEQRAIESLRKTIEADQKARQEAFEADRKTQREAAEKVARAWESDRKAWQKWQESQRKAAEESNRKWDDLREFQRQSIRRMEQSIDKAVNQIAGLFTTQWGQLVESLVEPGCVEQFRKIGMDISRTMQRIERADPDGRQMEIDVLLVNGKEVVAVEVKANLKVANVEKHEENLGHFREVFHEYRDKEVLGAVAALSFDSDSDKYAWRRGMFVLKPEQGLVRIANGADFVSKRF